MVGLKDKFHNKALLVWYIGSGEIPGILIGPIFPAATRGGRW